MSERFTPISFRNELRRLDSSHLESDLVSHNARESIRLFANSEWRAINEQLLGGKEGVKKLQMELAKIDVKGRPGIKYYNGETISGKFGLQTLSALIRFQRDYELDDDGKAGAITQAKIREILTSSSVRVLQPTITLTEESIPEILRGFVSLTIFKEYFNADGSFNSKAEGKTLLQVTNHSFMTGQIQRGGRMYNFAYKSVNGIKNYYLGNGELLKIQPGDKITFVSPHPEDESNQIRTDAFEQNINSLPQKWKNIYLLMRTRAQECRINCEDFGRHQPLLICDRESIAVILEGKIVETLQIIGGEAGFTPINTVSAQDRTTPTNLIHRFNTVKFGSNTSRSFLESGQPFYPDFMPVDNSERRGLKWNSLGQFYYGERKENGGWVSRRVTVIGVSLQSPESMQHINNGNGSFGLGGRYFHLVGPARNRTHGCVGIRFADKDKFYRIARIISQKGGTGFVA